MFFTSYFIDGRVFFRISYLLYRIWFDDNCVRVYKSCRSQSNVRQSNPIELQSFDWLRLVSVIQHDRAHPKFLPIEHNRTFRMEASKIVLKSSFISFQTRRCCQQISYVLPSISNTSTQGRCRREQRQRKPWNYQFWKRVVINEGYHGCPFAVGVDVKFIFEIGV